MKEFIEKLIGRLEEEIVYDTFDHYKEEPLINMSFERLEDIVNQLAEEYKHCDLCYLGSPCEYQNPEISCEKCIEYDTEEHCCPKFCKVITDTIQEMKEEHHNNDFCEWKPHEREIDVYFTECGQAHIFVDGNPEENNHVFCPYCGKKIKVVE